MITPLMNLVRGTLAVLACLSMTGCYSLQRIDSDPGPLQQMLREGRLVKAGDTVRVRTSDGGTHRFRLVAMDQETLQSRSERIPIDQVVECEREEFSLARTLLLGAGLVVAIVGLAAWSADWNSIELFEGSTASAMGGG